MIPAVVICCFLKRPARKVYLMFLICAVCRDVAWHKKAQHHRSNPFFVGTCGIMWLLPLKQCFQVFDFAFFLTEEDQYSKLWSQQYYYTRSHHTGRPILRPCYKSSSGWMTLCKLYVAEKKFPSYSNSFHSQLFSSLTFLLNAFFATTRKVNFRLGTFDFRK